MDKHRSGFRNKKKYYKEHYVVKKHEISGIYSTILLVLVNVAVILIIAYFSIAIPESNELITTLTVGALALASMVLLLVFIPLARKYHNMIQDMIISMHNHIDDIKNRHITMTTFTKEITISDDLFKSGHYTTLHHKIRFYNHQKTTYYDDYLYKLESSQGVSKYEDYKFWINGNQVNVAESHFKYYDLVNKSPKDTDIHGCTINIHVGIPGNASGLLEIKEEKCPCFSELHKAYDEGIAVDTIGLMVYYPTNILKIVVKLDDNLKGYVLESGAREPEKSHTGASDFKVIDQSKQRIEQYELKLRDWGAVPEYSRNSRKIVWEIHNPKVGYRYHLPFALVKTN